jgi:hypothetical protein
MIMDLDPEERAALLVIMKENRDKWLKTERAEPVSDESAGIMRLVLQKGPAQYAAIVAWLVDHSHNEFVNKLRLSARYALAQLQLALAVHQNGPKHVQNTSIEPGNFLSLYDSHQVLTAWAAHSPSIARELSNLYKDNWDVLSQVDPESHIEWTRFVLSLSATDKEETRASAKRWEDYATHQHPHLAAYGTFAAAACVSLPLEQKLERVQLALQRISDEHPAEVAEEENLFEMVRGDSLLCIPGIGMANWCRSCGLHVTDCGELIPEELLIPVSFQ